MPLGPVVSQLLKSGARFRGSNTNLAHVSDETGFPIIEYLVIGLRVLVQQLRVIGSLTSIKLFLDKMRRMRGHNAFRTCDIGRSFHFIIEKLTIWKLTVQNIINRKSQKELQKNLVFFNSPRFSKLSLNLRMSPHTKPMLFSPTSPLILLSTSLFNLNSQTYNVAGLL